MERKVKMTRYEELDFSGLLALSSDEVVTHSYVRDVVLASGKRLALITLDNDLDYKRPNTLGPRSLLKLDDVLVSLAARAAHGEIQAVAITGKQFILAAGADLSKVREINSLELAQQMSQLGHRALGRLGSLGVPSFAFINGLALGGGLEVALNSTYRTVDTSAAALALPEVFLGLIPGWGGATILPRLIGLRKAISVVIENPLKNNRTLTPADALSLGIVDVAFGPARFLEQSLSWADSVLSGNTRVVRPHSPSALTRRLAWPTVTRVAQKALEQKIGTVPLSPYAALRTMAASATGSIHDGFIREDGELAKLISGDQFQASMYAFNLVQKHAKKPNRAPDKALAQNVTKVGIIGAGLMARQFALLFVRRLRVPVVLTDIDQSRLNEAVSYIHKELEKLNAKGRLSDDELNRLNALVTGTTDIAQFADADWIIEAVFEELKIKQDVFARIESVASPEAVFATNTSSLSVNEIGAKMRHPERLVGFHFFNPVAVMPLIEVVNAPMTSQAALATAMSVAGKLKKTAVITSDSPGFVVNRLLAMLLGEAMHAVDEGTKFEVVDHALDSFGLPMSAFELLDLVGLKVGAHVLDTHHAAFPERFFDSPNLHRLAEENVLLTKDKSGRKTGFDARAVSIVSGGQHPTSAQALLERVQVGLAREIQLMLDEGVVTAPEDIDLCMITGAGWPFQMGGITPYLDRVGASLKANGKLFHNPPIRGVN
jgi:3-hydroxyacyl-CoA dehydrogenase/enoyl-CoA hydratase/carnithine racemase